MPGFGRMLMLPSTAGAETWAGSERIEPQGCLLSNDTCAWVTYHAFQKHPLLLLQIPPVVWPPCSQSFCRSHNASVLPCQPCPSLPFWPCYLPFLAVLPTRPQRSMLFSTLPGTVQPTAQATMHLCPTRAFSAAAKALLAVLLLLLLACRCYCCCYCCTSGMVARHPFKCSRNGGCIHALSRHHM
jgi:hypothetical protein